MLDSVLSTISDSMPDFNMHALTGFVRDEINESYKFPELVLREGFKLIDAPIKYEHCRILGPEETIRYEMRTGHYQKGSSRARVPLTTSHLQLVNYVVSFQGKPLENIMLYTPYLVDNLLVIADKKSVPRKILLEQTFARIDEKDKKGMSISPIRVNILFNRKKVQMIRSYVSGETQSQYLVTSRLFFGKPPRNKICDTSILHYFLAKFGFPETLRRFGISAKDVLFTTGIDQDTDQFEYYAAVRQDSYDSNEGPPLFLKVNKKMLYDQGALRFIVNLHYVLSHFDRQTIQNVYDPNTTLWKVILGIINFGGDSEPKALNNAETTLRSVDHFIDPITQRRFRHFNLPCNDMYDVLVYTFQNIDTYMVNHEPQDIYKCRLDIASGILVPAFAVGMFGSIYLLAKRNNIAKIEDVKRELGFSAMLFRKGMSKTRPDSEHYIAPPEIINDNFLFAGGFAKIRMGGKPEQRLHPSMISAESCCAFVGKHVGKMGYLNPYGPTDKFGAVIKPEYAEELEVLRDYLPR